MNQQKHDRKVGKPLRRSVGHRPVRKTLAVFCEGARTEPEYLDALRREPAVRDVAAVDINVQTSGGDSPMTLVNHAVAAQERARLEEGEIDEFWCVFDVEWPQHHPDLLRAVELARTHGVRLAVSNPCFEIWLALHFADYRAFLNNDEARRVRRSHDGRHDKGLDGTKYIPARYSAMQRAAQLDKMHIGNGTVLPDNNPSSGMHLLIASVVPPEHQPTSDEVETRR